MSWQNWHPRYLLFLHIQECIIKTGMIHAQRRVHFHKFTLIDSFMKLSLMQIFIYWLCLLVTWSFDAFILKCKWYWRYFHPTYRQELCYLMLCISPSVANSPVYQFFVAIPLLWLGASWCTCIIFKVSKDCVMTTCQLLY